jgi:hypothetical protein
MAHRYSPLTINRSLAADLHSIQTAAVRDEDARVTLGKVLQSALKLEFATIPTYLSAAFSLDTAKNDNIYQLIVRVAKEEMLHMTVAANLMNAIGIAPDITSAVPDYPYDLTVIDPPLRLDLRSFSFDLVENLFMHIETPEDPVAYPAMAALAEAEPPKTIGQFYTGIIAIIAQDTIPDLFTNAERDAYKQIQVDPNFSTSIAYASNQDNQTYPLKAEIDFNIRDKDSAVRHLSWVVGEGEGTAPFDPLTAEGLPGHYYRFESILKSRYLIKAQNPAGYAYTGGDIPFDPTGVHEFDNNAKSNNYAASPLVQQQMKNFNTNYTSLINFLHQAFNCPTPAQHDQAQAAYDQAIRSMRSLVHLAAAIIRNAKAGGIKAGIPFEYARPPTA